METKKKSNIDWALILVPFFVIATIGVTFFLWPEAATNTISSIRATLDAWFSPWYCLVALFGFGLSVYLIFSPIGRIQLGNKDQEISNFRWGAMVFTSTTAADLIFFGLCEWAIYAEDPYLATLGGSIQDWAPTFSLFHWGPLAWCYFMVFASVFGFMIHVRGRNSRRFSEACRPLLGDRVDGFWGKLLDIVAIFGLLAAIASGFSVATPLLSGALGDIFGFSAGTGTAIMILIIICAIYSVAACLGMKAISRLSAICIWLYFAFIAYVFILGGRQIYILETAITSLGNFLQNFIGLSTQLDPLRTTSFPQNWTIFYWTYWMVWCVGVPFFIAQISKGKTIRQVVVGGYAWGLAGTWVAFMVLGNYGQSLQMIDGMNISGAIAAGEPIADVILTVLRTLPGHKFALILMVIAMSALYCTTLDTLVIISAAYCSRSLAPDALPKRRIRLFWAVLYMVLPIALLFAEGSFNNMQSVSIIAALPISIVLVLCAVSFLKDSKKYLREKTRPEE